MKIGIDARPLTSKKTGIGYYLSWLLKEILEKDKVNEYYLFSDRKIEFEYDYSNLYKIEDKRMIKKTLWYFLFLPKLIKAYDIELFWGTQHILPYIKDKNVNTILTIHDLVCYEYPNTMGKYNRIINKTLLPYSVRRADKLIAVSENTKDGIIKYFGIGMEQKINVIYEDVIVNDIDTIKLDKKINSEYILFVGTIEPRKNLINLLDAYSKVRKYKNIKLIIAGKLGWGADEFKNKLSENAFKEDIEYLDYISEEEKINLIKNCKLFVFPSLYEGFGLPVLEAMRLGTIPVVSNSSSLKELVEVDYLKFNPNNTDEIADKILELLENEDLYAKALEYIKDREKEFDWNIFSDSYIKLFKKISR